VQDFVVKINSQLALYKNKKGITGRPGVLLSVKSMPANLWWDQNGSTFKELQMMARIVLAQPASASICERINSEFAFIKDRKRNRLGLVLTYAAACASSMYSIRVPLSPPAVGLCCTPPFLAACAIQR
jgi:hypothetical protein